MVHDMKETETMARYYRLIAIVLVVFTAVILASMAGLTWAIVAALKDTKVSPGMENDMSGGTRPCMFDHCQSIEAIVQQPVHCCPGLLMYICCYQPVSFT